MNNLLHRNLLIFKADISRFREAEFFIYDPEPFVLLANGKERGVNIFAGLLRVYELRRFTKFEFVIRDSSGIIILMLKRGCWFFRKTEVWDGQGKLVGSIQRNYTEEENTGILDATGKLMVLIQHPHLFRQEHYILSVDEKQIASIADKDLDGFREFKKSDRTYVLDIKEGIPLSESLNIMLVASVIFVGANL